MRIIPAAFLLAAGLAISFNSISLSTELMWKSIAYSLAFTGPFTHYFQLHLRTGGSYPFYANLGFSRLQLWVIGLFTYAFPAFLATLL